MKIHRFEIDWSFMKIDSFISVFGGTIVDSIEILFLRSISNMSVLDEI